MSTDEFLAWDAGQTLRNEFVRGRCVPMLGSDERHNTVALNLYASLRTHLQTSACRTFALAMRLRVAEADAFFYPDVMVTCSAADAQQPLVKSEPVLVIEVLSPGTAAYDRGDKFAAYRTLASLREYLLADVDSRRCDLYRKGPDGLWVLHPFGANEGVHLASVNLRIGAAALWAEVPPATPAAPPAASGH